MAVCVQLAHRENCALLQSIFVRRPYLLLIAVLVISCGLSACSDSATNTNGDPSSSANLPQPSRVVPDEVLNDPIDLVDNSSTTESESLNAEIGDNTPSPADVIANELELTRRLQTSFNLDGQQLVPTTGWICEDVFEQNRIYYFYEKGVLDAGRNVVIERTLIADDQINDLRFFWSVSGPDSILMSSTIVSENGNMLSSGQQYDVTTIRFNEVDSQTSFSAQSLLRGKLVCAIFNLQ